MRYFVEFHFSQIHDAWAIPIREMRERYAAVDRIVNGPDEGEDEAAAMERLVKRIREGRG